MEFVVLVGSDLSRMDLLMADISFGDLRNADLTYSDMRGVTLRRANLTGANLVGAQLSPINIIGSNVQRWGAHLEHARMDGPRLRGVAPSYADHQHADRGGAHPRDSDPT